MTRKRVIPRRQFRYIPRSRTQDPWTSHVAGKSYEDQTIHPGTRRHLVLRLYDNAPDGLIGDELPNINWFKRVSELRRFKLLHDTQVTRITSSGKEGIVHIITDHGRHVLTWLDAGKPWPPL